MTGDKIMAISTPERLFSSPGKAHSEYLRLIKIWHPDKCSDPLALDITTHLTYLWREAEKKIASNKWEVPGFLELKGRDNKTRTIKYCRRHPFELGEMFYGSTIVVYVLKNDYADLFNAASKMMLRFNYKNEEMEKEFSRYLPFVSSKFETVDNRLVMVMRKTQDVVLLKDVLDFLPFPLDPKHVAWILSSLCNVACYLEYAQITHNDISPETYFISPQHHSGMLLGGWWYAAPVGAKLNAMPDRSWKLASSAILHDKRATTRFDRMLVRALGREILGDITGMSLTEPEYLVNYLKYPSSDSAVVDYRAWTNKLKETFGVRRFTKMEIDLSDIYDKENK